jgi:DNA invertase Pin-like site-specific DNA recombinase
LHLASVIACHHTSKRPFGIDKEAAVSGKLVAYVRVSTDKQGRSGLGLEAQEAAVAKFAEARGGEIIARFVEVESGKRNDRPELGNALAACRKHKATLVIAKLDRLARNVAFIANLMEGGVDFVAVDMPSATRLTIHILAAVAEHEREMISARTKAALQARKARGDRLGAPDPTIGSAAGVARLKAQATAHAENIMPIIDSVRSAGIETLAGIAAALNARGIKSARGGDWHPASVARVIARAANGERRAFKRTAEPGCGNMDSGDRWDPKYENVNDHTELKKSHASLN